MADNVHLRIGSRPAVLGKHDALIELQGMFDRIGTFGAGYREVLRIREAIVVEATILFRVGQSFNVVPCALIARAEHGLMTDMRFYLDRALAP